MKLLSVLVSPWSSTLLGKQTTRPAYLTTSRRTVITCNSHTGERRAALFSLAYLPLSLVSPFESIAPHTGECTECLGSVANTLGTCASWKGGSCVSTFDDRPPFFLAPWELSGSARQTVQEIKSAVEASGGAIQEQGQYYLYATFGNGRGGVLDDVEFLVSEQDGTVVLRSASRTRGLPDGGRNRRRLENLRIQLDYEEVPILRNRRRKFLLVESPWDDFGPTPPPGELDYNNVDDTLL
ncbi:hypothetical protein CYMTET_44756 [Cymbomonas tetramitiformis]|uniref:Uncharacterized protein n=1 Tax=Cymbomonas tetramitiformis TaxID=36881 RepID=A0AAE0BZL3_9CHLO|nr:hypothetical protein CYMTET_44756 [Cymbomonas tetramitiformis]